MLNYLAVLFIYLGLMSLHSFGQSNSETIPLPIDSITGKIIYTASIKNDGIVKDSIYKIAKAWIDSNYNSEYVIYQVDDLQGGKLRIIGDVILKATYAKLDLVYYGEHTLEINVRDNEYDYSFKDFKLKKYNEIANEWYEFPAEEKYPPEKKVYAAKKMYIALYNNLNEQIGNLVLSLLGAVGEYDKSAEEEWYDEDEYWEDDEYREEDEYKEDDKYWENYDYWEGEEELGEEELNEEELKKEEISDDQK